jgi:hypothetical protein
MSFNFAKSKAKARQAVHKTLAVSATYEDSVINVPVAIKARWLTKLAQIGDLDNAGYAEVLENIDRVILERAVAREIPVSKLGVIRFTDYADTEGGPTPAFILAKRLPTDGPFEEVWEVTRE